MFALIKEMKNKLIILLLIQAICCIVYSLLTKIHHQVIQEPFWPQIILYTEKIIGYFEQTSIVAVTVYIVERVRRFWRMLGIELIYLVSMFSIQFVIEWGVGTYGFSSIAYVYSAVATIGISCVFSSIYFMFYRLLFSK